MTSKKVALITGVTGQDGAILAELLLSKDYIVHGVKRRSSLINTDRIDHLYHDPHEEDVGFFLHYGDLTDSTNLIRIIQEVQPDEIYNHAAQSHVQVSFETPEYTANSDALGTLRLLEAIRILNLGAKSRFYQASTSELYGKVQGVPQNETTPFYPRSPLRRRQALCLLDHGETIAKPTECMRRTAFFSIMKDRPERRLSSPAKSPAPSQRFTWGFRTSCSWAISTPNATGQRARLCRRDVAHSSTAATG